MRKDSQEREYLAGLIQDCGQVELRAISSCGKPRTAWHHDTESLIAQARIWSGEGVGLYVTMASPSEALTRPLRDNSVSAMRRLLFDFDRKDCGGQNATDDELAEAMQLRSRFVQWAASLGFPAPALAMSGNGVHAVYRIALRPSEQVTTALSHLYRTVHHSFQSENFKLDSTTRNPAQLCRLYGTKNRKYPEAPNRPQRVAYVTMPPGYLRGEPFDLEPLLRKHWPAQVLVYAPPLTRGQRGRHDWRTLDMVSWFQANQLYLRPLGQGKHAVMCPWQLMGEHEKSCVSDTVIWERGNNGFPSFFCSHDTCRGRGSIQDLVEVLSCIAQHCES